MFGCCRVVTMPLMANALLLTGGSHPRDGAGVEGNRRIDRRRNGSPGDSPMDILTRLPAVVVLERVPVPTLAMRGIYHLVRE